MGKLTAFFRLTVVNGGVGGAAAALAPPAFPTGALRAGVPGGVKLWKTCVMRIAPSRERLAPLWVEISRNISLKLPATSEPWHRALQGMDGVGWRGMVRHEMTDAI